MYVTTLLPFTESLSCITLLRLNKVDYFNIKSPTLSIPTLKSLKHVMEAFEQNFFIWSLIYPTEKPFHKSLLMWMPGLFLSAHFHPFGLKISHFFPKPTQTCTIHGGYEICRTHFTSTVLFFCILIILRLIISFSNISLKFCRDLKFDFLHCWLRVNSYGI